MDHETKKQGVVRVFFRDNTFKSFSVTEDVGALQLCDMFARKMRLQGRHFSLLEVLPIGERRLIADEKPLLIMQQHLLSGLPFGRSSSCGFVCIFNDESLRKLKAKLSDRRTWLEDCEEKQRIEKDKEKQELGEKQLYEEFGDLLVSLQEEKRLSGGRERTNTAGDISPSRGSSFVAHRRNTISSSSNPFIKEKILLSDWNVTDVTNWLAVNGLAQYEQSFQEEAIDGCALLVLSEKDLRELGVKMGHRKKILLLLSNFEERRSMRERLGKQDVNLESNTDLDQLIIELSGLSTVGALAELENADVDSFLSLLAKQLTE